MSTPTKPSIVFAHGIWADGSCFSNVIPPLQADGYEVMAAQYGLDTKVEDVAATIRTLNRVHSPAILVGHSYGGSVITAAGTDDRVAGLDYICALGPDETETETSQVSGISFLRRQCSARLRSLTGGCGCSRPVSAASAETCPRKSSGWFMRLTSPRPPTCSCITPPASRGGSSRAGASWATTTKPFTRNSSAPRRSGWAPPPTTSPAATSPCCCTPTSAAAGV
jgi:pimeloyl-ACP methyl ester carboxylesterase